MTSGERAILHIDMDAFYAAVEQRDRPELRGKPVAVGGLPPRGVVAAASYEARSFRVHSALPVRVALTRCPNLICIRPRMEVYRAESKRIFAIFQEFTPEVEGLSLDEAFLDVTASLRLWSSPTEIANRIKQRIRDEIQLTCSVGVAHNKLIAKIASAIDKPDGLVEVTAEQAANFLGPLPIKALPGLGPKARARLEGLHIDSIAALGRLDPVTLKRLLGAAAGRFQEMALGHDSRSVARRPDRSLSAERTFDQDLSDPEALYAELATLSDRVAERLREKNLVASTVVLKLRQSDFTTATRQAPLANRCNETRAITKLGRALLDEWLRTNPGHRLRLLGIRVTGLDPANQATWLDDEAASASTPLDRATDDIRRRFGNPALTRARQLPQPATVSRSGDS